MATTRMLLTTAVLAAVAALLAAPSQASFPNEEGDGLAIAVSAPSVEPGTIPYLSHGIGVDESLFAGRQPDGTSGDGVLTRADSKPALTVNDLDPAIARAIDARYSPSPAAASIEPRVAFDVAVRLSATASASTSRSSPDSSPSRER